jgi:hypothetical protein
MTWKYEYTRTWKPGISKKIIYRLKLWEIHVCYKLRETYVKVDESSFDYAKTGHVCLQQHHAGGFQEKAFREFVSWSRKLIPPDYHVR